MKKQFLFILAVGGLTAANAVSAQLQPAQFMVITGDAYVNSSVSCPDGYRLASYEDVSGSNYSTICRQIPDMGEWYIVRLAGGGSADGWGKGYDGKFRQQDFRREVGADRASGGLGHSLCVANLILIPLHTRLPVGYEVSEKKDGETDSTWADRVCPAMRSAAVKDAVVEDGLMHNPGGAATNNPGGAATSAGNCRFLTGIDVVVLGHLKDILGNLKGIQERVMERIAQGLGVEQQDFINDPVLLRLSTELIVARRQLTIEIAADSYTDFRILDLLGRFNSDLLNAANFVNLITTLPLREILARFDPNNFDAFEFLENLYDFPTLCQRTG